MKRIHEGLEQKSFLETKPTGVIEVEVCKKSGFLATTACKRSGATYTEYFIRGTEPIRNLSISFITKNMYRKWISSK